MARKSAKSLKNCSVLNSGIERDFFGPDRVRELVGSPLPTEFFARQTVRVAKELLGKILIVDSRLFSAGGFLIRLSVT